MLSVGFALGLAGLVAGVTGAWSPCGFSMVETIGREDRSRATTLLSCAAFTAGSLCGGVLTFGTLALAGWLLHDAGEALPAAAAAALALAAAVGEARGTRIVPQIRRQVPEPWRRTMPLPLAAMLYGVLLGMGFTTFVLTWGVWALAAIALALGDPALGLLVGLAFGAGRALPVIALAPRAGSPAGLRAAELMAERPSILRSLRLADALALAVCAAALGAGPASAASVLTPNGHDPSVGASALAWDSPEGAVLLRRGVELPLPGAHPALGGSLLAWAQGDLVRIVRAADLAPVLDVPVARVDAVAISPRWLVYRTRSASGRDRLTARSLVRPGVAISLASAGAPAQLSRPSVAGDRVAFAIETRRSSSIVERRLSAGGSRRVLRSSTSAQLLNPTIRGGRVAYVRATDLAQQLLVGPRRRGARDRVLYRTGPAARRDRGHQHGYSVHTRTPTPRRARWMLWTTALSAGRVYLTLLALPGHGRGARIVAISR